MTAAAAVLRVRRPSGATATFHATACRVEAGVVTVVGSWADLPGARHYSWPARRVLEIRWQQGVAA
jgi:hypothetical protein